MLATLILSCNLVAVCTNEHVYLFDMLSYFLLKINCGFGLFSDFSCKGMDAGRQLCNSDNPPNHPPRYPGKWSRNNLKGVTISKEEYLDQQIDEWLAYVSAIPHICHFFYTGRIFESQIFTPKNYAKHPKITTNTPKKCTTCSSSRSIWKILHRTEFFYTGTARGARDKYH